MLEKGYFITAELRVLDSSKLLQTKKALYKLCEETLKEPGCNLFTLHQCNKDENCFLLWERFDNEEAFKQHFNEQHTKDYIALDLTEVVQFFQTNVA